MSTTMSPSVAPRRTLRQRLTAVVVHSLAISAVGMILWRACFISSRVVSQSMRPTLVGSSWYEGDRVLIERVSSYLRAPRRWEVVAFRREDGSIVMKRVIALPGESVQMLKDGRINIDGRPVERPAHLASIRYIPIGNIIADQTFRCEGGYYLLGDDARDSDDSRYNGVVKPEVILGRGWLIYSPWERAGWIK